MSKILVWGPFKCQRNFNLKTYLITFGNSENENKLRLLTTMFSCGYLSVFDKNLTFIGKTFPPENSATSPTLESPTTLAGKGTAMQGPWKGKQMGGRASMGQ